MVAGRGPPLGGIGALDDGGKLQRGVDGTGIAGVDDGTGDAPRHGLFAVAGDDVPEHFVTFTVHEAPRRFVGVGVHTHVERPVGMEAETAFGEVYLHG